MTKKLSRSELDSFLEQTLYSVIHLDAEWDGYRLAVAHQISRIESSFKASVSFGYMDVDDEQEFAREIKLRNTPACAYYKGKELIATVIGIGQDISANLKLIQNGGVPDSSNWISRF